MLDQRLALGVFDSYYGETEPVDGTPLSAGNRSGIGRRLPPRRQPQVIIDYAPPEGDPILVEDRNPPDYSPAHPAETYQEVPLDPNGGMRITLPDYKKKRKWYTTTVEPSSTDALITGTSKEGYNYPEAFKRSTLSQDIPQALGITTTDKSTPDVFAERPILRTGSVFSRLLDYQDTSKAATPVDATLLNNPAVEGLETMTWGAPLGANFEDKTAMLSGSDSAAFMNSGQTIGDIVSNPAAAAAGAIAGEAANAVGLGNPLAFFTDPDVRKQTYIFVIGAIILVVGLFALTR
jgi:hypothetical protein